MAADLIKVNRMRSFCWRVTFTHRNANGTTGATAELLVVTRSKREKEAENVLREYITAKGEILAEIHDLELEEDRALVSPSFFEDTKSLTAS